MAAPAAPANVYPYSGQPVYRMKPGHWILLVLGVLLAAAGAGLTLAGSALLASDAAQQDGRYLVSQQERLRTTGYALVSRSARIDFGGAAVSGIPGVSSLGDLASLQVRVTPVVPGQEVFVGIGDAAQVAAYLKDVPQASLSDVSWWAGGFRTPRVTSSAADDLRPTAGSQAPAAPAQQTFWAASASGAGTQQLAFDLREGEWTLVVMNANSARPLWADVQFGVRSHLLGPLGGGLLAGGLVGLVVGVPLLLFGAAGLGRDIGLASRAAGPGTPGYPVLFTGFLDPPLSRGLWLVKWLLVIPHAIVLAILWPALFVTTIAAGIAILFTGRYPRSLFTFSVGVLRWTWRVGFYAYAALGTDRYPPFTLASAPYPADLDVAYPERLSRGLVLVKWWLLVLPQLLIVAALTGSAGSRGAGVWWDADGRWAGGGGFSLLGLLVLITAVILLFTGRYQQGIFDFVVGINRWVTRVGAYALLLRDDYPPFRLDQGAVDPPAKVPTGPLPPVPPGPPPPSGPGQQPGPPPA
ncbi:DUF4389 domain-containing protein [Sinomonas sp. B1-1]|uniref:DUF4389 domain-containing protein n=1 Tax=Sinomonas sp. B1-1 TaxID=3141454 RepID=UPI003D2CC80A